MNNNLSDFKILSGSALKLIAIITMFIDHTALLLRAQLPFMDATIFTLAGTEITLYYIMRRIGRVAFPIFCFLSTQGYTHTKNLKKYLMRLLVFAAISEIPFNLMLSGKIFYSAKQNVFFTLFLGLLLIYIFENTEKELKKAGLMLALAAVSLVLNADYGIHGVLLILLMYILRNRAAAQVLLSFPLLSGSVAALTAFIPINMYNGQRGFVKSGLLKYGFYLFYPLHMIVLVIIKLTLRQ